MRNKQNDIPYLCCRQEKILNATPILNEDVFRMLVYWISERSKIHIKKDIQKQAKPWTQDSIFQTVRFTNVRRELDKESIYLINTVCKNKNLTLDQKLANIIFFRIINKKDSVEKIFPIQFDPFLEDIYRQYAKSLPKDYPVFKKVYMISGTMGQIRMHFPDEYPIMSVINYVYYLWKNSACTFVNKPDITAAEAFEKINAMTGIGEFLAYQIFIDLTYCPEFPCSENEFVVAGPGCKNGLKLLFKSKSGMTPEECLFWIRDNWNQILQYYNIEWNPEFLFQDLPEYDRTMNIMSLQNCFCELYKFDRAYRGEFVIRKYNGRRDI